MSEWIGYWRMKLDRFFVPLMVGLGLISFALLEYGASYFFGHLQVK